MQSSINLLGKALDSASQSQWARKLGISRQTINTAKARGNLSPSLAFCIAEELGENALYWQAIAAAEGEKESAARDRMIASLKKMERAMGIEPTSYLWNGYRYLLNTCMRFLSSPNTYRRAVVFETP